MAKTLIALNKTEDAIVIIKRALSIKHNKILYDYLNNIEAKQRKLSDELMISKFHEQTKIKNNLINTTNNQTETTNSYSFSNSYKYNKEKEIKDKDIKIYIDIDYYNKDNLFDKEDKEVKIENSLSFFSRFYKIFKILIMYMLGFFKSKKPLLYIFVFLLLFFKKNLIFGFLKKIFFSLIVQKISN
jgi:hypothetical protein